MRSNWKWLYLVPAAFCIVAMLAVLLASDSHTSQVSKLQLSKPPVPEPTTRPSRRPAMTNPMVARPNMVDRLVFVDSQAAFDAGKLDHVAIAADEPARLVLAEWRETPFPRVGTWTSPEVKCDFNFTELIPSWNASTPPNTGVRFHVRARDAASGRWTPWLYIGQWGRSPITDDEDRVITCDLGCVNIDNLTLDSPADMYQMRVTFLSYDLSRSVNPSLRRLTVSYSGQVNDDEQRRQLQPPVEVPSNWARDIPVPFRAQGVEARPLRSQICSPTSTSMVMAFMGVDRPTEENALAIYDNEYDLFGNWGRAVQRAGELGLDGWVQRFRNWDQVKAMIARGQPVIAGIKFKKGEFPSNVNSSSAGHLIVIRGFKENGDVICNDPASKTRGNGVVYKADELAHAWFGCGGVGYIIKKHASPATMPTAMR
jgi:hypothetical protein